MIDGELFAFPRARYALQGRLVASLLRHIYEHVERNALGETLLGVGHYPAEVNHTVLGPAISFTAEARLPEPVPDGWLPLMPDLAVELAAPSETLGHLRQKAAAYLRHGGSLVWILLPGDKGVDVCRSADGSRLDIEFVGQDGVLSGEDALPGFELALSKLFPVSAEVLASQLVSSDIRPAVTPAHTQSRRCRRLLLAGGACRFGLRPGNGRCWRRRWPGCRPIADNRLARRLAVRRGRRAWGRQ